MNRRLTSLLAAAIAVLGNSLDVQAFDDGNYFIKNVESGLFLAGGNNWGTQGTVADNGDLFTLTKLGEGSYSILNTYLSCTSKYFGSNLYVDGSTPNGGWIFTEVEGGFTISNGGKYLVPDTQKGTTLDFCLTTTTDGEDPKAVWKVLTKEEAIAELRKATQESPQPATFLLKNPNFNRNYLTNGWTISSDCTNSNLSGGNDHNNCAESFHSKFTISQKITGVPNGIYKVKAQGFYRQDGTDNTNLPYLFANDAKTLLPTIESDAGKLTKNYLSGSSYLDNGNPNNMHAAGGAFAGGLYFTEEITVTVTNSTLEVGFMNKNNTAIWCIFDNISLEYYGVDLSILKDAFNKAVTDAEGINTEKMNADVLSALNAAIAKHKGKTYSTEDELTAAIDELTTAQSNAAASIELYKVVADYTAKAANLDAAGQASYAAAGIEAAYNAGSITETESAKTAYIAAVKAQTSEGSDITEVAPQTWTCEQGNGPGVYNASNGIKYTETYKESAYEAGKVMYQRIEGLQNGKYEVKLLAVANAAWDKSSGGQGIAQYYLNNDTYDIDVNVQNACLPTDYEYTAEVIVTDGTLEYGLQNKATGGNWYVAHLVSITLKSLGVDLSTYAAQLTSAVEEAKTYTDKMNATTASSLSALISQYDGKALDSEEKYTKAINDIKDAITAAKASIANYAAAAVYVNRGEKLDARGKASYEADATVTAVIDAYNDGTLEAINDEQIAAMKEAFVTATKLQTSENSDFTGAIVNPDFETVNPNDPNEVIGWTVGSSGDTGVRSTASSTYVMEGSDGKYLFNTWATGLPITQTIEGLPNGTYRLTATVASDNSIAIFLLGNGSHNAGTTAPAKENGVESSLDFYVTDGTATIGAVGGSGKTFKADGGDWYKVDGFHLTFLTANLPTPSLGTPTFTGTESGDRLIVTFDDFANAEQATSASNKYIINITINGETYSNISSADNGAVIEYDFTKADAYTIVIPEKGIQLVNANGDVIAETSSEVSETLSLYSSNFTNADFGLNDAVASTVRTYAKDITGTETSGMQKVTGWNTPENGDGRAAGTFTYGSSVYLGGEGYQAPAQGPAGTNGKALGLLGVWTNSAYYTQTLKLTAGKYMLSVPTYNAGGTSPVTNLTGVIIKGTSTYSNITSFEKGVWTYQFVEFSLDETSLVTVSLGYTSPNAGSSSCPHLFFDRVEIFTNQQIETAKLEFAKNNALASINTLAPVGEGIFKYQQDDIDAAIAAINAANTVEEVEAVSTPSILLPDADKAYQVILKDAGNYMTVTGDGIKLSQYAQPLYFSTVEGGYALSNGTEYVAYAGTNAWTLNASFNAAALTVIPSNDAYNIKGKNGYLGVDDNTPGSNVYGNKDAFEWYITEFTPSDANINGEFVINSYDALAFDNIAVNINTDGHSAAILNNGKLTANSATLNLTIENGKWSFVKFPCDVPVSALTNSQSGTQWKIYKYDGDARAKVNVDATWVAISADATLKAGQGYIIQSRNENNATSTFTFTTTDAQTIASIFVNADIDVDVNANESTYDSNAGWNLIGNPYVSYFDIRQLSVASPITVWENETYTAINPADDDYALMPLQAFFVQVKEDGVVTFDKNGRQTNSLIAHENGARLRGMSSARKMYNLTISDGRYSDKTRVVLNPVASADYEIGTDASKFMSTNADVPQLYTIANGVSYAINERPAADGVVRLGAYFGKDGEYTINASDIASPVVLEDKLTGTTVVLDEDNDSYTFTAKAGKSEGRFVLYVGENATSIASVEGNENDENGIYTLQGIKVSKPVKGGIYIVNGKKVRY